MSTPERVAVVVVHGIADQRAGQTVREVARLLCHGGAGEPRYVQGEMHEVLVPVAQARARRRPHPPSRLHRPAAGKGRDGETAAGNAERVLPDAEIRPAPAPSDPSAPDLGLALNDYLLGRLELPEPRSASTSPRASRSAGARTIAPSISSSSTGPISRGSARADGGRCPRSYQLFFHLSTLAGRRRRPGLAQRPRRHGLRLLQRLHAWLAWLMRGPGGARAAVDAPADRCSAPRRWSHPTRPGRCFTALFEVCRGRADARWPCFPGCTNASRAGAVGEAPGPAGGRRRGRPGGR